VIPRQPLSGSGTNRRRPPTQNDEDPPSSEAISSEGQRSEAEAEADPVSVLRKVTKGSVRAETELASIVSRDNRTVRFQEDVHSNHEKEIPDESDRVSSEGSPTSSTHHHDDNSVDSAAEPLMNAESDISERLSLLAIPPEPRQQIPLSRDQQMLGRGRGRGGRGRGARGTGGAPRSPDENGRGRGRGNGARGAEGAPRSPRQNGRGRGGRGTGARKAGGAPRSPHQNGQPRAQLGGQQVTPRRQPRAQLGGQQATPRRQPRAQLGGQQATPRQRQATTHDNTGRTLPPPIDSLFGSPGRRDRLNDEADDQAAKARFVQQKVGANATRFGDLKGQGAEEKRELLCKALFDYLAMVTPVIFTDEHGISSEGWPRPRAFLVILDPLKPSNYKGGRRPRPGSKKTLRDPEAVIIAAQHEVDETSLNLFKARMETLVKSEWMSTEDLDLQFVHSVEAERVVSNGDQRTKGTRGRAVTNDPDPNNDSEEGEGEDEYALPSDRGGAGTGMQAFTPLK
jgi:hypothetical protein